MSSLQETTRSAPPSAAGGDFPQLLFVCDAKGKVLRASTWLLPSPPSAEAHGRSVFELFADPGHPFALEMRRALEGLVPVREISLPLAQGPTRVRLGIIRDPEGAVWGGVAVARGVEGSPDGVKADGAGDLQRSTWPPSAPRLALFAVDGQGRLSVLEQAPEASDGAAKPLGEALTRIRNTVPEFVESCQLALAGHEHAATFPLPDGSRHHEVRFVPIQDGEGRVSCVIGMLLDVTERKTVEENAQHADLRLIEADRMAALGGLAGGVAHQINNALAHMRLSIGRLISLELSRKPVTPVQLHRIELLQDVREGVTRIERITRELKAFSRVDEGPIAAVNVRDVLDSAIEVASYEIRHRATVVRDFRMVPLARGTERGLRQAFLNILVNAAQSIPEGEAHLNEIRVLLRRDEEGRIVVEVRDTGAGIPPEALDRVFDPFFTTKPTGEGIGLGLSVCRDIVTALGGEIVAENGPTGGTIIRVFLQASDRPAASPPPPTLSPAAAIEEGGASRILIVDDDRPVAAAMALELGAHDVVVAGSGREALEILRKDKDFDVIFCDLMMPELTGMDVYQAVKPLAPALADRFVFMTGGAFTPRGNRFFDEVSNLRIEKPFRSDDLQRVVRRFGRLRDRVVEGGADLGEDLDDELAAPLGDVPPDSRSS